MNPILKKFVDIDDQTVTDPASKDQYDRIVIAGKKVMFDPATHDKISWMQNPTDLAALVTGVSDLIVILGEKGEGMMPEPAAAAARTLVMEALDFAERAQGAEITQEMADTAVMAIEEKLNEEEPPVEQPTSQPSNQPTAQPTAQPQGLIQQG